MKSVNRDNNYFDCNGGIILYVIWNINLWVQNIAKYLFEMERIDVRIEHVLEFSIKIVLSVLKIGSEPDSMTFPVGFSPGLLSTEIFESSWLWPSHKLWCTKINQNSTLTKAGLEVVILVGVLNLENQFV